MITSVSPIDDSLSSNALTRRIEQRNFECTLIVFSPLLLYVDMARGSTVVTTHSFDCAAMDVHEPMREIIVSIHG